MHTPASFTYHTHNWPRATFLCVLMAIFAPLCADAQCSKTVTLDTNEKVEFKLKPKRDLNSTQLRVGDYVEFELLEDLKWSPNCADEKQAIITKGTPVIGRVLDRHHRFTIFKKGSFGIGNKLKTTTVDGKLIELEFNRPLLERKPKRLDEKPEGQKCVNKIASKENRNREDCVKGRVYAAKFIASLPSAVLSVAAATALVRVKDDAEAAVIGVTLIEKIASQTGLSNILNGVDAEMSAGEIFDAKLILDKPLVIKLPGDLKKDEHRVARYRDIPTPADFVVTDYFSDLSAYPAPSGVFYNGQLLEKHTDKVPGETMRICAGQKVPEGWETINSVNNPKICPRDPGHESQGATYIVILKKK